MDFVKTRDRHAAPGVYLIEEKIVAISLRSLTLQSLNSLGPAGLKGGRKSKLSVDSLYTVRRVDVLDKCDLEAGSGTLARSNGGVGQEELPDAEPALAVLGGNLLLVADPVAVPFPEGGGVVHTDGVNLLDLETSALKLVDDPAERCRSVGTREDVLVHEKTPCEILKLPLLAETSDLEEENTVVIKHVTNLGAETGEVTDTDVLGHLEAGNLLVATGRNRNIAVIHAENVGLVLSDTRFPQAVVAPLGLVAAEGDTSNMSTVVNRCEPGQSTPAAANVKHLLALLEANLFADNSHLVILELFEGLLTVDVRDDTGSVDHTRAKEPAIEVVTAVVVVTDLLLV